MSRLPSGTRTLAQSFYQDRRESFNTCIDSIIEQLTLKFRSFSRSSRPISRQDVFDAIEECVNRNIRTENEAFLSYLIFVLTMNRNEPGLALPKFILEWKRQHSALDRAFSENSEIQALLRGAPMKQVSFKEYTPRLLSFFYSYEVMASLMMSIRTIIADHHKECTTFLKQMRHRTTEMVEQNQIRHDTEIAELDSHRLNVESKVLSALRTLDSILIESITDPSARISVQELKNAGEQIRSTISSKNPRSPRSKSMYTPKESVSDVSQLLRAKDKLINELQARLDSMKVRSLSPQISEVPILPTQNFSDKSTCQKCVGLKSEIEDLHQTIATLEHKNKEIQDFCDTLDRENQTLRKKVTESESFDRQIGKLESKLSRKRFKLRAERERVSSLDSEVSELREALRQRDMKLSDRALDEQVKNVKTELLVEEIHELHKRLAEKEDERAVFDSTQGELRRKLVEAEKERDQSISEASRLRKSEEILRAEVEQANQAIDKERQANSQRVQATLERLNQATSEISELRQAESKLRKALSKAEQLNRRLHGELVAAKESFDSSQAKAIELKSERDTLARKLVQTRADYKAARKSEDELRDLLRQAEESKSQNAEDAKVITDTLTKTRKNLKNVTEELRNLREQYETFRSEIVVLVGEQEIPNTIRKLQESDKRLRSLQDSLREAAARRPHLSIDPTAGEREILDALVDTADTSVDRVQVMQKDKDKLIKQLRNLESKIQSLETTSREQLETIEQLRATCDEKSAYLKQICVSLGASLPEGCVPTIETLKKDFESFKEEIRQSLEIDKTVDLIQQSRIQTEELKNLKNLHSLIEKETDGKDAIETIKVLRKELENAQSILQSVSSVMDLQNTQNIVQEVSKLDSENKENSLIIQQVSEELGTDKDSIIGSLLVLKRTESDLETATNLLCRLVDADKDTLIDKVENLIQNYTASCQLLNKIIKAISGTSVEISLPLKEGVEKALIKSFEDVRQRYESQKSEIAELISLVSPLGFTGKSCKEAAEYLADEISKQRSREQMEESLQQIRQLREDREKERQLFEQRNAKNNEKLKELRQQKAEQLEASTERQAELQETIESLKKELYTLKSKCDKLIRVKEELVRLAAGEACDKESLITWLDDNDSKRLKLISI